MKYRTTRDHDHESIHRAADLLRTYHARDEDLWLDILVSDKRPNGHYSTICAIAAIADKLAELVATWSNTGHETIINNYEAEVLKMFPQADHEEAQE